MIDVRNEIAERLRQDAPSGMTNLQVRIISGVILAVVVLTLTWLGGLPFRILAALISAAVLYEWVRMPEKDHTTGNDLFCIFAMLAVLLFLIVGVSAPIIAGLFAIAFVLSAAIGLAFGQGTWNAWGILYGGAGGSALAYLRADDAPGLAAILFLFAVVWATDIFAYFTGRSLGGIRLAPRISPKKTWSGAIGGAAASVGAGVMIAWLFGLQGGWTIPIVAILLSVVSQCGDLFESWVKRRHDVKDSSNLIPGHGGVMDRVDGLVVAAVALFLIGWMLADREHPAHGLFGVLS